ncbi:hypothetical protein K490DRAFT_46901 [Saccharata proteae CBS 121410]|uniref:General stress protein FMN-binding split barrel domain-containing protein n=1 Tax=Saccharata proteae CBS 121410 TaxID=1314787 RepID=A0A9P4HSX0_9PEZI|nr:hypothetical protein K490DRAFT_46901 [Saccharata proteae CBS 121410]
MPEPLTKQEITSKTDPTVAKQYDHTTPRDQQLKDLYHILDSGKVCLLATQRPSIGPVSRSMAIAERKGPDFLFIANAHSQKFSDLEHDKKVQITYQNSSTQDWVSVTGTAEAGRPGKEDPRIEKLWNQGIRAWFGDLGDGVHTGGPEDPRMKVISVRAEYISYWKANVTTLGFIKEVVGAAVTGGVANTGLLREIKGDDLEHARNVARK